MNKINLNLLHTCYKSTNNWDCMIMLNDILQSNNIRRKINLEMKISNYNNRKREQFDILLPIIIGILYLNRNKYNNIKIKCKLRNIEFAIKEVLDKNWDLSIYRQFETYQCYEEEYYFNSIMKIQKYNYSKEIIENKILLTKYFLSILCEELWFISNYHPLCKKELDIINPITEFYKKKIEEYIKYNSYEPYGEFNINL